jgi:MFS family permease
VRNLLRYSPRPRFSSVSRCSFYYTLTNIFLNNTGVHNAAGEMTGGQMSELLCMLLIPWFFRRLGVKYMLAAGMGAWVLRYLLLPWATRDHTGGCCGSGFSCMASAATFSSSLARSTSTAKPHRRCAPGSGLISFITYGLGMSVGSWLSGAVVEHYTAHASDGTLKYDWRGIWVAASVASAIVSMNAISRS